MKQTSKTIALIILLLAGAVVFYSAFIFKPKTQAPAAAIKRVPTAGAKKPETITAAITPVKTAEAAEIPVTDGLRVPVLMYHHVADLTLEQRQKDPEGSDLTVSPTDFETEMQFLSQAGYHSVSMQQLYAALNSHASLPSKPIVISFDDGYQDVFTYAIPIMQKYGFSGSFAIITDKVGTADYAPWDAIIDADKAGMEIVSHTVHHPDLTDSKYTEEELRQEIFDSKATLESKLGHAINFFVYPYGKYNYHVAELSAEAGYQMAFTTAFGLIQNPATPMSEPRVRVHGIETMDKFEFSLGLAVHTAPAPTNP